MSGRRAERAKEILATSRGRCRDIKGRVRDWFLLGVDEVGQRLEEVGAAVRHGCILAPEPVDNLTEPVGRGGEVHIDEETAAATTRDGLELHAGDVARVRNGQVAEGV